MKVYFLVIIVILVVVIFLLFYLIYKIYILHVKSYEDGEYDEEEASLSLADEIDARPAADTVQSSQESISTKTGSSSISEETTAIQPHIKSMLGPILHSVAEDLKPKNVGKEKCSISVSFEYVADEMKLMITLLDASNLPKPKSGSSEAYIDMQITPYKHRTYRPPGYRRPLRGCLKRSVDFTLEPNDISVHYFVLYLLRYDPFTRLDVVGEVKIPLNDLEHLLDGEPRTIDRELTESNQQFTGFVFRHGSGSTRSLNGSSRSTNGSPSGMRRSFDESSRASSKSFNGFSRALDESTIKRHGSSYGHNGSSNGHKTLTLNTEEKLRASSRSFGGSRTAHDEEEFGPTGLTRSRTEKPRRKRKGALHYSPLARQDDFDK